MTPTRRGRTNLVTASREWSSRPADQRFWTLRELFEQSREYAQETVTKTAKLSECEVIPFNREDLALQYSEWDGRPATFGHYSFGQLCNIVQAPTNYLRGLPAQLAADNLNHGLWHVPGEQVLLLHKNGGYQLRCVTSDSYSRIWNWEVAEMALALEEGEGWKTPPARPCGLPGVPTRIATEDDVLHKCAHPSMGIRVGDEISPAGLYVSDHDLFIFQVNEDYAIDAGGGEMLYRGVFWSNSEVGDARFRGTMFLFDSVCGNHICWSAKIIADIALTHRGTANEVFREMMGQAAQLMTTGAGGDERRIQQAKQYSLGNSQSAVIKLVFGKNWGLSKEQCENAMVLSVRHADDHGGDPLTAWGYVAGLTRLSQGVYADKRVEVDRAAGKILDLAF